MPYAAVNDTHLFYRIDGAENHSAPWVVLSNSLGSDVSMWTPQIVEFTFSSGPTNSNVVRV